MHPASCPSWEYKDHPNYPQLAGRCRGVLVSLRTGGIQIDDGLKDTRPFHEVMFVGLTPKDCTYFAGHFRGEAFKCLQFYDVRIPGDDAVGTVSDYVAGDLANFTANILQAGLAASTAAFQLPNAHLPEEDKLMYLVQYASKVLVEFLRIHPYANGNGHVGRFLVWLLLARFGYWPKKWPLNTSPPYHQLIFEYRQGKHDPLEEFILRSLTGV